jgi:hypothetical protein
MLPALRWFVAAVALAGPADAAPRQGADDPAVRAAVEDFFAVQQVEDIAAYLALWSARARGLRPSR